MHVASENGHDTVVKLLLAVTSPTHMRALTSVVLSTLLSGNLPLKD